MTTTHDRRGQLFTASGVVSAPVGDVSHLLLTVRAGPIGPGNAWLLWARGEMDGASLTGGPRRFSCHAAHQRVSIDVDAVERTVAVQGGWWYRGEYAIEPCPGGTRIVHRIDNVARRGRWAVPLANRGLHRVRSRQRRPVSRAARPDSPTPRQRHHSTTG